MRPARMLAPLAPVVPPVAHALRIPLRLPSGGPGVALTFDDGPHPEGTPAVLEILAAHGATATFFLVGEQVRRAPGVAQAVVAAGHAIAVHGDRHRPLPLLTSAALRRDLDRAAETIVAATGLAPTLHRAPYGAYSGRALTELRRRGWAPQLWSKWGRDWSRREDAAAVSRRITRDLRNGDVLLLHDADDYSDHGSWRTTVAALPGILAELARRDLATVTLPRSAVAAHPAPPAT